MKQISPAKLAILGFIFLPIAATFIYLQAVKEPAAAPAARREPPPVAVRRDPGLDEIVHLTAVPVIVWRSEAALERFQENYLPGKDAHNLLQAASLSSCVLSEASKAKIIKPRPWHGAYEVIVAEGPNIGCRGLVLKSHIGGQ